MALDEQSISGLEKFKRVAKEIVYKPGYVKQFQQMLGTPEGAVAAIQTVLAVIEKHTPIPPQFLAILGKQIYVDMVDIMQEASKTEQNPQGIEADPGVMKTVLALVESQLSKAPPGQQHAQPMQSAQPQGLMASMQQQGAAA